MRTHGVILVLICCFIGCLTEIQTLAAQQFPASVITVEAVMQHLQDRQDLVLIDVRGQQTFERLRIPGSLNIPLFAVKTKAFLKHKPVVLVDEGYRPRQLADACEELRQAGFDARFLFGGLNAWRMWSATRRWASPPGWRPSGSLPRSAHLNVLPLQGDVFAQKTLNRMPPQALFVEQDGEHWLIIDVSASGETQPLSEREPTLDPSQADSSLTGNASDGELHPPGPPQGGNVRSRALSVPFDRDHPQSFLADVAFAVTQASARSEGVLVVIANQRGENYEAIAQVLWNTQIAPVFFLEGGFDAYTRFVTQQNQIRQGQPQDITTSCQPCAR